MNDTGVFMNNGSRLALSSVPTLHINALRVLLLENVAGGAHVAALFPVPDREGFRLFLVLVVPENKRLLVSSARVADGYYSFTGECPEVHAFEREMAEQWGIVPHGHPYLKPLRFHAPLQGPAGKKPDSVFDSGKPGVMDFFQVDGEEVHEVAVGPVHAGVIEPGHFRFQCHGEKVFNLEIALGYQHRGVEKMLLDGPDRRSLRLVETAAGDTSVGHATAYALNIEALAGLIPPENAVRLRSVALELERLANHVGDLGALAGDVGFLPTSSYCGRLRGDLLNFTAQLCGNRFGRGLAAPGGAAVRLERERADRLMEGMKPVMRDVGGALKLLFRSPSVSARFEDAGKLDVETVARLGLVGPAARAAGLLRDVRVELPAFPYDDGRFAAHLESRGDVAARALVREKEIIASANLVARWLRDGCEAPPADRFLEPALTPDCLAVSLVEGWRGEICHVAVTDDRGRFAMYKIVDPSFHNWQGLAVAMRGQQISDFPLCNKSFNLSYCGHDL